MSDTSTTPRSSAGFVGQWSGRLVRALEFGTTRRPVGGDWALWHQACAGHAPSATELVQALTPQAHGLAMQMLRKTEDAQDVVQESFLRLWHSQPSDAMGAQLATYFHTIVLNRCRTHLTRRREFGTEDDALQQIAEDQQRADASHETELPRASAAQLQRAMAGLRPRQRMALGMWAYADADVADIARALEIDVNAAHQLLHRAKLALRTALSGVSP